MARGKMKVSELEGAELDFWVAKAEGYAPKIEGKTCFLMCEAGGSIHAPSTNWSQGGPIIEREKLSISYWSPTSYGPWQCHEMYGATPLIAAMRAYVASKFGEEVE